jgi:hypothetical protein
MRATNGCEEWNKGWYGLVESNDPFFVFDPWKHTLRPDPMFDWSDDAVEGATEEQKQIGWQWIEDAEAFREALNLPIEDGWRLIEACKKAGWSQEEHGDAAMWLFHRLGMCAKGMIKPVSLADHRERRRTFDDRLREILAETGIGFVSQQVGKDNEGVFVEVGYFIKDNTVDSRKFYVLPGDPDPWTDSMVACIATTLGRKS